MSKLYLYSQNWEDWKLASSATAELGVVARKPIGFADVRALLEGPEECLLFVDGEDPRIRAGFEESAALARTAPAARNRVFYCVSREGLRGFFSHGTVFGSGAIVRRSGADLASSGRLLAEFLKDVARGGDLPSSPTAVRQSLTLKHTRDKAPALQAVSEMLSGFDCDHRVTAAIETAVDEILTNAIFDAPVDGAGKQLYGTTPRSTEMELRGRQEVSFSFAQDGGRLFFTVKDRFGTLDRDVALRHVTRDFRGQDYRLDEGRANAGLGLATGFATGASFLFLCEPGVRTEVTAIFGMEPNYRVFQEQFQFVSARIVGPG